MCRELNSFSNLHGGNNNYDPWEIYNFPPPPPAPVPEEQGHHPSQEVLEQVEPEIPIENPPSPQPQPQQQDELVEENNELYFSNGDIPNVENEDDFLLPEPVDNPFMAHHQTDENGAGQAPNENSDGAITSDSQTQTQSNSLSELEDFEFIDRRIKVLNISLFILETVNIIFNEIRYQQERPE